MAVDVPQVPAVHVAGACQISIAHPDITPSGGSAGDIVVLGWTRNMPYVTKEAFWQDVPGDELGGDDGPPIDVIFLGEIARIRLEMTKWEDTVADLIRSRVTVDDGQGGSQVQGVNSNAYTVPITGTLMFSQVKAFRVLLKGASTFNTETRYRNFNRCIPRGAIEIGRGTKYSSFICEFEAHADANRVLYNEDITLNNLA